MALIMLSIFLVLIMLGFPIFACMGIIILIPNIINPSFIATGPYLARTIFNAVNSTTLLAIPLFILSGEIMGKGGISGKLFEFFTYLVGKRRGGIPSAVILTSIIYAAICGAGAAAAAAVGAMAIPTLLKLGYKKDFAANLVGSGGGIGIIIPPSIPFITYAMMTGVSVGALFTAGFIPGILIGALLILYIWIYCGKEGENKEKVAEVTNALHAKGFKLVFKDSFWALLAPVIILGSIYTGIATPTEAATVSVLYATFISMFVYKTIKLKELVDLFASAVRSYAGIGIMIAFGIAIGRVLALLNFPVQLEAIATSIFSNKWTLLAAIISFMLVVGMFMDVVPAVMIFAPLFLPIVESFGVDSVHFGIILTVTVSIGLISPPYGLNLFVTSSIVDLPVNRLYKNAISFCVVYILSIIILTVFPQISLFLDSIL